MKTGAGLAAFAESLLSDHALTWYMYGNNGHKITEQFIQTKKLQYPNRYSDAHITELRKHLGAIGYDCSSITDVYTGSDRSANGWLSAATEKGPISTIPDIVGLTVHYNGHMGIYVGGGYVVEARGTWYGIVKTRLKDRGWQNWAKVPGVDYTQEDDMIFAKYGDGRETSTSSSKAVWSMQDGLTRLGIKMINDGVEYPADGRYGNATSNGVSAFKLLNNLPGGGESFDSAALTVMLSQLAALDNNADALAAAQDRATAAEKRAQEQAAYALTIKAQYNKLANAALVIRDAIPM